jgi:hypothetical protein
MSHLHGVRKLYHELDELDDTISTCSGLIDSNKDELNENQLNVLKHDLENLHIQRIKLIEEIELHKK